MHEVISLEVDFDKLKINIMNRKAAKILDSKSTKATKINHENIKKNMVLKRKNKR